MHLSLINPYIRVAMKSKILSGHNMIQRVIYDYELIYLESGAFTFVYNDISHQCTAGDIIFIHPGIAHSFQFNQGEISQPHIHFDITYRSQSEIIPISFKDFDQMSKTERDWIHKDYFHQYSSTPFLTIKNKPDFLKYFYLIIEKKDDPLLKKALMIQLLSMIIKDNYPYTLDDPVHFHTVYQIKDYIDAGNGLGMSLDDFAKTFFHSKFHLERKFKEAFGVNLIEYRNEKRMALANCFLKTHSVSKVAELLDYQSIYAFSRAYKQYYGYSPSKHMK